MKHPIALPFALTATAYLALGQVELLLSQFEQAQTATYGVTSLGGGLTPGPDVARAAILVWNGPDGATSEQARLVLLLYAMADVLFMAAYAWLFFALMKRSTQLPGRYPWESHGIQHWYRKPFWDSTASVLKAVRPLTLLLAFDVLEDAARILVYQNDGGTWLVVKPNGTAVH